MILGPVELQLHQVARVQAMNYMVSLAGEKTRIGVLLPKDAKKEGKGDDLQKYLAKQLRRQDAAADVAAGDAGLHYQQYMKLMQQMVQQTQPVGEFNARRIGRWTSWNRAKCPKAPDGPGRAPLSHGDRLGQFPV